MNISSIEAKVDSKLVASQINGSYEANKDIMIKYLAKAKEYISCFKSFSIGNIPRSMNQKANVLSKLSSVAFNHLTKEVLVEVLNERSTKCQEVRTVVEEEGDNWMTPIIQCLERGIWLKDKNKVRCLRAKISQYTMESEVLFKKGYLVPMLRCVGPLQANYVIWEIHMGSCGIHVGSRVVIHALVPRLPKTLMTSIMAPWPFYQWGMDILGPLSPARGGAKFVIMAIDYFTKWVEAKPLVRITGKEVIRFVMDNIICRFGLPRIIVTDNGAQLVNDPFKGWGERFEIHQMNTALAYPQANGLVEKANRSLMEGIKTQLGREKVRWGDELPNVLWAHRTSIKQSNGETLFSLTYGSKAVIPAKIGIPTYRTLMIREGYNEEEMRLNLDLLQEIRETTAIRDARYKTKMEQYYNKRVRLESFKPREFVFWRNEASRVEDQGKLGHKWEGTYRVVEAYENGSYKFQTLEDEEPLLQIFWKGQFSEYCFNMILRRMARYLRTNEKHYTPQTMSQRDEPECTAPKGIMYLTDYESKGRAKVHNTERHYVPHRLRVEVMSQSAQHRKALCTPQTMSQRDESECTAPKGTMYLTDYKSKGRSWMHSIERHYVPHGLRVHSKDYGFKATKQRKMPGNNVALSTL
ncbi:reverse transcriptase domain-containing protein [Tanacetum coccineum]